MSPTPLSHRLLGSCAITAVAGAGALVALPASAAPEGPKNIIVMIGDGMGFNHVDAASLYQHGTQNHQVRIDPENVDAEGKPIVEQIPGEPSQVYEGFDVQLAMSSHSLDSPVYDPQAAWSDFDWANDTPTDSAASGTALATGEKTNNGLIGVNGAGADVKNVAEHAHGTGRATGVVTDVPFGHATPASWGAHVSDRGANHDIARQMIDGPLDVVIGAGHPNFDDDGAPRDSDWVWLTQEQYEALPDGERAFVETGADLERIAGGQDVPEQLFGLMPVAETLQFNRSGEEAGQLPFEVARNDLPELKDLSSAALNVLGQNEDGMFLMVEAGAVDWAGHANSTTRNIEEMTAFNDAVESVHDWVESESSWDETLLIVTADHETGYLEGENSDPTWEPLTGEAGALPAQSWYSGDHTNHLVPFFAQGAGSDTIGSYVDGTDPARGDYLDNTDVAKIAFDLWPSAAETTPPTEEPTTDPTSDAPEESPSEADTTPAASPSSAAASRGDAKDLPRTGSDLMLPIGIGAALLAAGGTALWLARRRGAL